MDQKPRAAVSLFFLFAVALAISLLVGSRLRWSENPGFRFMESYSVGYNFAVQLGDLCSSSPLAGLEGLTSNVTDQESWSFIYALPNKLFRGAIDLFTLHRIMEVLFFAASMGLLVLILFRVELSLPLALFMLVHWGLSSQNISYLYESKLVITSVLWLTLVVCLLVTIDRSGPSRSLSTLLLVFLLPLIAAAGYETYAVSRPLGLVMIIVGALWIGRAEQFRTTRWRSMIAYVLGTIAGVFMLHLIHPQMRFNQKMFEGRTESIITPDGLLDSNWYRSIQERISEMTHLFHWPTYSFSSEMPTDSGWLDILIPLITVALILAAFVCRKGGEERVRYLYQRRWLLLLLFALLITGLSVPLFSTTSVRGHRWFAFYFLSTLVLTILAEGLCRASGRRLTVIVNLLALCAVIATAFHRVPLVAGWKAEPYHTPAYSFELIETLRNFRLSERFAVPEGKVEIRICDHKDPPDWEHFWNSAMYVSELGCRMRGDWIIPSCDCDSMYSEREKAYVLCVERWIENEKNRVEVRYRAYSNVTRF